MPEMSRKKMTERYKVEKSMYSIHVYMININCQHRTCLQKYEIEARVSETYMLDARH